MAGNELAVNHDGNMVKTGFKNVLTFHIELYILSLKILTTYSHRFLRILCNVGEKYECVLIPLILEVRARIFIIFGQF